MITFYEELTEDYVGGLVAGIDDDKFQTIANPTCKHCHGRGYTEDVDYVEYWGATVSMVSVEVCDCTYERATVPAIVKNLEDNFTGEEISKICELLCNH